ncbi:MAG: metallophosphoesterase [Clostridiales Family XIII bacterium]|jgi:predicted phosphohydrolase|nr:metallophosphoesterase [Clostridiales Family XIII bacterium]
MVMNKLFAIADPHLSFASGKPMDIFGDEWQGHWARIAANWREDVSEGDTVIVAGDISWALKFADAIPDLDFLHGLPGRKLLVRGNHDLWWHGIKKLNAMYGDMRFLQNDFAMLDDGIAVCGSRGWGLPGLEDYGAADEKIAARECIRLRLSFDAAVAAGAADIVCATHFPPALTPQNSSIFTDVIESYPVSQAVYGHLHGRAAYKKGIKGEYRGVVYRLVSCDYLGFRPLRIL